MWPFRRKRGPEGSGSSDGANRKLEKQVEMLHAQVLQLQQQLAAVGAFQGEYLYRMRSVALPILGDTWELRYFVLQGTTIKYFKSHKDVIFSPREEFSTLGCSVEWQGLQGTRFWAWTLVDPGGSELLRMASQSEQTALRWVAALEQAGCKREVQLSSTGRQLSMPTANLAAHGLAIASSTLAQLPSSPAGRAASLGRRPATPSSSATPLGSPTRKTLLMPTGSALPSDLRVATSSQLDSSGMVGTAGASEQVQVGGRGDSVGSLHQPPGTTPLAEVGPAPAGAESPAPGTERATTPRQGFNNSSDQQQQQQAPLNSPGPHAGPKRRRDQLPSSPVHTASKYSYLSSERVWHERHTGLYNLMAVILLATNFRLALENALKYGWRINPYLLKDLTIGSPNVPVALCYPLLALLALLALGSEQLGYWLMQKELQLESALSKKGVLGAKDVVRQVAARRRLHESCLFLLNTAVTSATIALPWVAISSTQAQPVEGALLICLAVVWWMKLVSFHHCCADLRHARRVGEIRPGERGSAATPAEWALLMYPENLTIKNLLYFLAAPTLSYQVNYPRSPVIRWKWLARRLAELALMLTVMSIILKQFMEPAIANSMQPLQQMNWMRLSERLLKLALPNTYCWLTMFYCLFHLWLNILAELLRFGDREFYKDWWNAPTLGEYWKLWNMPVHKWLLRHVYFPALRLGLNRISAMVLVFLVSAAFHELLLGVPLHMVRFWAFTGIMLQVPMIMLTEWVRKRLKRDEAGNYVFWLTFCVVGQPLSMLLYAHDYIYQVRPSLQTADITTGNNTLPVLA